MKRSFVDNREMPLLAHLSELRHRLIVSIIALVCSFVIALFLSDFVIEILKAPFLSLSSIFDENTLYINTIYEGFLVRIKVAALTALVLSLPVHLFNITGFVFPGLHKNERRIIKAALFFSFLFLIISFYYSFYTILPVSVEFLTSEGIIPEDTGILLNFTSNISYVLQFILVTLLVFQLPIILEILLILNVLSRKTLLYYGRFVVILFFVLSAILTPPDFVTQIGIALPLTFLYYLTILIAKIFRFGEE